ncbi:MAG: Flp pilus assembly complex ATPase component TadA [Phycisphaerae bacterium]|nr:Flp pilus assembly complex ATPase component TadA [Phycisphaerae bacterium]
MSERTFTTYQVAELLGQTPGTVVEWIQKGWLPVRRMPEGSIRISERGLVSFLQDRGVDLSEILAGARFENAPGAQADEDADRRARKLLVRRIAADPAEDMGPREAPTLEEADMPGDDAEAFPPDAPPAEAPWRGERAGGLSDDDVLDATEPVSRSSAPPPDIAPEPHDEEDASPGEPPQQAGEALEEPADAIGRYEPASDAATGDAAEQVIRAVLADALDKGATAVHFEPSGETMMLRLRVGYALRAKPGFAEHLPEGLEARIVERLKTMAGLKANAHSRPQQGTAHMKVNGRDCALQIATCPTTGGERIAIHLDRATHEAMALDALRLSDEDVRRLRALAVTPGAMVLLAGAPRTGRTALLHSLAESAAGADAAAGVLARSPRGAPGTLAHILAAGRDGLGYATALSAAVAQDMDLIAIDDLRDPATALDALEAARSGVTILAAMQARDAAAAIGELLEMGVEPWPLAETLSTVVETCAVARLCEHCKRPGETTTPDWLGDAAGDELFRAVGCAACGHSGYTGRALAAAVSIAGDALAGPVRAGDIESIRRRTADARRRAAAALLTAGITSLEATAEFTGGD